MSNQQDIFNLFPNLVAKIDLNQNNDALSIFAYNVKEKSQGRSVSNMGGGWQSEDITEFPVHYEVLIDMIILEMLNLSKVTSFIDLEYQNSWININGPGSYNARHMHAGSIYSGVYYVKVPEGDCGKLIFHRNDDAEYYLNSLPPRDDDFANVYKYINHPAPPSEGTLLLFPSWLHHSVSQNNTDEDRISVSFNFGVPSAS